MVFPPGVFITTMPLRVAASHVDGVHPRPGAGDGLQVAGSVSNSAVILVALRTITASAARRASRRASSFRPGAVVHFDAGGGEGLHPGGFEFVGDEHARHVGP
jgi:hypothetical protein